MVLGVATVASDLVVNDIIPLTSVLERSVVPVKRETGQVRSMQGKIALEEHFALEETVRTVPDFAGGGLDRAEGKGCFDIQDRRLKEMDAHGIGLMLLSLNAPAIQAIPDRDRALELSRRANDLLAARELAESVDERAAKPSDVTQRFSCARASGSCIGRRRPEALRTPCDLARRENRWRGARAPAHGSRSGIAWIAGALSDNSITSIPCASISFNRRSWMSSSLAFSSIQSSAGENPGTVLNRLSERSALRARSFPALTSPDLFPADRHNTPFQNTCQWDYIIYNQIRCNCCPRREPMDKPSARRGCEVKSMYRLSNSCPICSPGWASGWVDLFVRWSKRRTERSRCTACWRHWPSRSSRCGWSS